MPYNEDVDVKLSGEIAGTSLEEIGRRIIEKISIREILAALSSGYLEKYGVGSGMPAREDEAWTAINDLMGHFDETAADFRNEPMETNQMTLIRQLWALGLIDYEESLALKEKFNNRVNDAVGVELDERGLQGLFELFNEFDIGEELAAMRGVEKKDLRPFKR